MAKPTLSGPGNSHSCSDTKNNSSKTHLKLLPSVFVVIEPDYFKKASDNEPSSPFFEPSCGGGWPAAGGLALPRHGHCDDLGRAKISTTQKSRTWKRNFRSASKKLTFPTLYHVYWIASDKCMWNCVAANAPAIGTPHKQPRGTLCANRKPDHGGINGLRSAAAKKYRVPSEIGVAACQKPWTRPLKQYKLCLQ